MILRNTGRMVICDFKHKNNMGRRNLFIFLSFIFGVRTFSGSGGFLQQEFMIVLILSGPPGTFYV